jgi:hypothetical protein
MRRRRRRAHPSQLSLDFEALAPSSHGITLTVRGITLPVIQWAVQLGVSTQTIYARIDHGWSPDACVSRFLPSPAARKSRAPHGCPTALAWDTLEYKDDDRAWYVTAVHPDGLEVQQVAELQGVSPSQVNKIVHRVREKVRCMLSVAERVDDGQLDVICLHLRGRSVEEYRKAAARSERALRQWAKALREQRAY